MNNQMYLHLAFVDIVGCITTPIVIIREYSDVNGKTKEEMNEQSNIQIGGPNRCKNGDQLIIFKSV